MTDLPASDKQESEDEKPLPVVYEDLRKQDVPPDFTLKLGEKFFPVHRKTTTTHSEYFRAMLEHDTKEKQQEFVDVIDVPIVGVRECVEFMYTGFFDVNAETVEDILKTADMWQLPQVTTICNEFLKEKLDSGNCVSVLSIATKYGCSELQDAAQQVYKKYFDIELSELLQLQKDRLTEFLESHNLGNDVAWNAISNWMKHDYESRGDFVFDFLKLLNWDIFPSPKLLGAIWDEQLVRDSLQCHNFLFKKLFLDLDAFKSCLGVESYYALKELSKESEDVIKQIKVMLSDFFKHQIVSLSQKPEFLNLESEELLPLFTSEKSSIFAPEKWWWNTAVMWVKHVPDQKKYFPELIRSIKFNQMSDSFGKSLLRTEPNSFARSLLRTEPLVKESQECFDIILNSLLQPKKRKEATTYVAVLYPDGRVRALNVFSKSWKDFAKFPKPVDNADIFYFNRKLCLINGSKLFYLQNNEWIERSSASFGMAGQKKVATYGDFIFVSCSRNLSCYNSQTDSWIMIEMPANVERILSVAALDRYVYIQQYNDSTRECRLEWRFDVIDKQWLQRKAEYYAYNLSLVDDEICSCDESKNIRNFDLGVHKLWGPLQDKPPSSWCCYSPASLPTLMNLNDRLVYVDGRNKIHIYDKICKKWELLSNIPVFVSGVEGQGMTRHQVVSACSFYTNPVVQSPL